jgi:Uma2 family endonuclease
MTIAPPAPLADALAPLQLPADLCLSPEQFAAVCAANPDVVLELDAAGHLIHMTPTGGETGARNWPSAYATSGLGRPDRWLAALR